METTSSTSRADDRVAQDLRRVVDDAEHLLKSTAHAGDEHLHAARDRLREEVAALRVQLADFEHKAATRLRDTAQALAGALLGLVLGRR